MVRIPERPAAELDKKTFDKKFRTEMPVVVKGLARAWAAFDRWEPAQLKRLIGDLVVQPFVAFDNVHFLENRDVVERREMPLAQVVEHVFEGRDVLLPAAPAAAAPAPRTIVHANGTRIETNSSQVQTDADAAAGAGAAPASRIYLRGAVFSALKEDIEVPQFMEGGPAKLSDDLSGIWIGSKGCITPLHFDAWHGVLCQVRGTKRVTLFSPDDTDNMYPCVLPNPPPPQSARAQPTAGVDRRKQTDGMNMHTSELVLEKLGEAEYMEKFPLAEELTPWVVDLEPGDAYAQLHRPVILCTH